MTIVLWVLSAPALAASTYLALLTLLSRRAAPTRGEPTGARFVVVVPAHDEEVDVANTVASLLAVDYPRELFRVLVIADNCTDGTAACALAAGATVGVRTDPSLRGKGYALAHAFRGVVAERWADAVVVVDADTVVSANLLAAFATRLAAGASAVQADYLVRNPHASWRTRLMTIAFAAAHTLRSRARERLGASCGLHGNGMCFTTALLREIPHDAFSIAEDLEYALRLGEAGHRVFHAGDAQVWGSMPAGESASRTQRLRWEGGRARLVSNHARRLLARGLRRRDVVALDLAAELLVPPLSTLVVAVALGLVASLLASPPGGPVLAVTWVWAACAVALLANVARGWQISGTGVGGLLAFVRVPGYLIWKATLPLRASSRPTEWVRTARKEDLR